MANIDKPSEWFIMRDIEETNKILPAGLSSTSIYRKQ